MKQHTKKIIKSSLISATIFSGMMLAFDYAAGENITLFKFIFQFIFYGSFIGFWTRYNLKKEKK
jgi:hypothetical protein